MRRLVVCCAIAFVMLALIWVDRSDLSGDQPQGSRQSDAVENNTNQAPEPEQHEDSAVLDSVAHSQASDAPARTDSESTVEASAIHVWLEPPEEIENRLREELSSERHGVLWDLEVTCTETKCTVHYTRSAGGDMALSFVRFVRSPPINASGVGVGWEEKVDGTFVYTHQITTYREPPPDNYKGLLMTAEELRQFSERYLSPDDIYATPVVVDMPGDDPVSMVIENICSTDCPLDLQQVVHWTSVDGLPCERQGPGVAQSFLVRGEDGFFEERTLCVEVPYDEALAR